MIAQIWVCNVTYCCTPTGFNEHRRPSYDHRVDMAAIPQIPFCASLILLRETVVSRSAPIADPIGHWIHDPQWNPPEFGRSGVANRMTSFFNSPGCNTSADVPFCCCLNWVNLEKRDRNSKWISDPLFQFCCCLPSQRRDENILNQWKIRT